MKRMLERIEIKKLYSFSDLYSFLFILSPEDSRHTGIIFVAISDRQQSMLQWKCQSEF